VGQAKPVREITENVTNTISGGTFNGPVLQGGYFINPTLSPITRLRRRQYWTNCQRW
jgi:hypothetical protein